MIKQWSKTPDQMFSRLPITIAQLKAGNNWQKLKKWKKSLWTAKIVRLTNVTDLDYH